MMASHLHLAPSQPTTKPAEQRGERGARVPISVALADDHPLMLRTLHELLDADPTLEVIAVEQSLAAVARVLDQQHPQVLVMDLNLPNHGSSEKLLALRKRSPDTQIVVLTTDDSAVLVQRVLDAGALGYVLKELADSELPQAVRAAAQGKQYVSPRVGVRMEKLYGALGDGRITPREVEVLRMIALGHTSVEIANRLKLSPRTIETHRAHIHQKLGLATRAELVRYALERGLLKE